MNQNQPPSLSLEQRIAAALGNPNLGSAELSELIIEVKGAAASADQSVADVRDQALDMLASSDIAAAHDAVAVAQLNRDRIHAVLPKLRERLSDALNTEQRDRWLEDYKRVKAKRDQAADMFSEYSELVARLVEIFSIAQAVDKEVSRVNGDAPDGEHRQLKSVELEARGLDRFTRDDPSITKTLQLSDPEQSSKLIWPPRESLGGYLAVQVASSMSQSSHPGGDWFEENKQQAVARRQEQERVAAFYDEQARLREEREARENAEVQEHAERTRRAR